MRVLHVVKTADGANWAAEQAAEIVKLGVEVHVALPRAQGRTIHKWVNGGAVVHITPTDLPIRSLWSLPATMRSLRDLVSSVRPDLIHSHFFGSTVLLRLALGANHGIPRLFQVPGPLHLEHPLFRRWELLTATGRDYWIASSKCILELYRRFGIDPARLFLSYYGLNLDRWTNERTNFLRRRLGLPNGAWIVGNISYIYKPKYHLAQFAGLKRHEDLISGIAQVTRRRPNVYGVLIGSTWGGGDRYERKLRRMARDLGQGRILMPGFMDAENVRLAWPDFDCAAHVPISENCGGVVEPLRCSVPTIASRVGGLPEVVIDGITGITTAAFQPHALAEAIEYVLDHGEESRRMARTGSALVAQMFDVRRTAAEVYAIYYHLLFGDPRPPDFDSGFAASAVQESALH